MWEVWNEPDYTDWSVTDSWLTSPPDPDDLYNWHGTVHIFLRNCVNNWQIYQYNRLMRITYEVVKYLDPSAYIATGGIGYYQ